MRALQLTGPRRIQMVDIPAPSRLEEGQVLVRTQLLSICGSDMRSYRRVASEENYPFPAGQPCHECVGVVEDSRDPDIPPGQRVIVLPTGLQGGREYLISDGSRLIPVPAVGDLSRWLMCQPLGTVLHACKRIGSVLGQRVAILGQGAIGLHFTTLLRNLGAAEVIAIDLLDYRLKHARQRGATLTLNPEHQEVVDTVHEFTGGLGVDIVVEAAGTEETFHQAIDLVRRDGTVVLFGMAEVDRMRIDYMSVLRKQATLIPAVSSASQDPTQAIKEAVSLVAQGRMDPSWQVTHRKPFEDASSAYDMYDRYLEGVLKVIMEV